LIVGPGRSWRAVPFLHRARDTVVRDQARTVLYKKARKDGRSGRHRAKSECNNSVRNRGIMELLRLRKEKTSGRILRKPYN
jgi:hypothetical protein